MLQDIAPVIYNNDFSFRAPKPEDKLIIYRGKEVLSFVEDNEIHAPTFADLATAGLYPDFDQEASAPNEDQPRHLFLFLVGEDAYYAIDLAPEAIDTLASQSGWEFIPIVKLVEYQPKPVRFALMVGHEYWNWYESSQYCGRCGTKTEHDTVERMMRCPNCGLMIFPKVFPAVIVAITRPDGKVLATRYAGRPYANYALVAGYCEMGETVEQTVHREVMEEVGLRVKNLRYYKSQPWPDSSSLLFGFFCELDGSPEIKLDEHELSMAEWVDRDVLLTDNDHSLTREMMGVLRDHRETEFCVVEASNENAR